MKTITVNGEAKQLADDCQVAELLTLLGLTGKRIALERNGDIVPRSQHASQTLQDGDKLEIVVAVGGG